ncbi:MAG TPA: type VI secretion system tip protein TssI/VgrG, partial [Gemmataceae bacterium]
MPTYIQANRQLRVTTPLGKDALLLVGMTGHEAVSQLFTFDLDGLAEAGQAVDFAALLGQNVTVEITLPGDKTRFVQGICNRVTEGVRGEVFTAYQLHIVPKLWLLTQRSTSRIFQQLSVPDILQKVLTGFDTSFQLQGKFEPRDYCVQYRETDFNFASRLMEEEGIYYFFKHTKGGHQMIVANSPDSHPDVPETSTVIYEGVEGGTRDEDRVRVWAKTQEVRSGKYTLWDHHFELPHKHLEATKAIQDSVQVGKVTHKLTAGANGQLELYDFPGEYAERFDGVNKSGGDQPADLQKVFQDNTRTVGIRMQEEAVPAITVHGAGDCRQFVAGHKFTLTRHGTGDGPYVLTAVEHSAYQGEDYRSGMGGGTDYSNTFICIPLALPFRPPRTTPKPVIPGTQTAVVVGPKGQEIFTDKFGRVKVQFHWDREGKNDADSSCWVRVAQFWAGKRWGAYFWPRIGQEVVIAFEEGDPDRPLIVGSVYNSDQMPPYLGDGPDSKHPKDNKVSGVKSNTTPGGVGFNEWRFDDTKGKEQVFIHGERDLDVRVKNDRRERVFGNSHLIVGWEKDGKKGGDQREMVYQNKHLKVHKDQEEQIGGNTKLHVGGVDDGKGNVDVLIDGKKTETVGDQYHLHVKKLWVQKVDEDYQLTAKNRFLLTEEDDEHHIKLARVVKADENDYLTVGGDKQSKVTGGYALEAGTVHLKAGQTVVIEAGTQLSLKVGGNFIDISSAGISIKGTAVMINSGGAAGSGSGASPQAPNDPNPPDDAAEAKPTAPDVAD